MPERGTHYTSKPDKYSQDFYDLVHRAYALKATPSKENDLNGIMVTKGHIRKTEIVVFDLKTPHDELLREVRKTRAESVIFTYLPPFPESTNQGNILVVATDLDEDKVQTCLEFIIGSWPEELSKTKIRAISPGSEEDYPYNEHIVFQGSVESYKI